MRRDQRHLASVPTVWLLIPELLGVTRRYTLIDTLLGKNESLFLPLPLVCQADA